MTGHTDAVAGVARKFVCCLTGSTAAARQASFEVQAGACADLGLRRIGNLPLECHWVSYASGYFQPETFDHRSKVQHRYCSGCSDGGWARLVVASDTVLRTARECSKTVSVHTVRRPHSYWRIGKESSNRGTGRSKERESIHGQNCVPIPWRKLFASTSHDISRLRSSMGIKIVLNFSYKTVWCGSACDICARVTGPYASLTIVRRTEGGRGIRVQSASSRSESHGKRIDWRFMGWRPALRKAGRAGREPAGSKQGRRAMDWV